MAENQIERNIEENQSKTKDNSILISSIRKNFAIAAPYQALIGGIFLILIWAVLNALDGMDLMYPYFTIPTFPMYRTIGTLIVILACIQFLIAMILPLLIQKNEKIALLICKILASLMLIILPTGTYFGLLIWQDLKEYEKIPNQQSRNMTEITETEKSQAIKTTMIASGLIMLHMPILLLIFYFRIITMPVDMAYPAMAAVATTALENVSWVLFGLFILQIIIGILYPKIASKKGSKVLVKSIALYQILSFGIFFVVFLYFSAGPIGLEGAGMGAIYISWIIGVILNPIGIHFGLTLWRQSKEI
jgi:hypothetical protein